MSDAGSGPDSDEGAEGRNIPFRLVGLDDFTPEYVNLVNMNNDRYTFHLAFSRVVSPIIVNNEDRERFEREGWNAQVVSRLVIPVDAFRDMVEFMQDQLDAYNRQFETETSNAEGDEGAEDGVGNA